MRINKNNRRMKTNQRHIVELNDINISKVNTMVKWRRRCRWNVLNKTNDVLEMITCKWSSNYQNADKLLNLSRL
jgi:hypothetical protein